MVSPPQLQINRLRYIAIRVHFIRLEEYKALLVEVIFEEKKRKKVLKSRKRIPKRLEDLGNDLGMVLELKMNCLVAFAHLNMSNLSEKPKCKPSHENNNETLNDDIFFITSWDE